MNLQKNLESTGGIQHFESKGTGGDAEPGRVWKSMQTLKENPESAYCCLKCKRSTQSHSYYTEAGISPCLKCRNVEDIAADMCRERNFRYLATSPPKNKNSGNTEAIISLVCDKGHETTLTFRILRIGGGCKTCQKMFRPTTHKSSRNKIQLAVRPDCNCPGSLPKHRPHFCSHYNHVTHGNGSADEWDPKLNGDVTPYNIAPCSESKYWFRCKNDHCRMPYRQTLAHRVANSTRCPYCVGQKACHWNSLLTNYPELCEELSSSNKINPATVTCGSNSLLIWECTNHSELDQTFTWPASPASRITNKTGCPKCNTRGYEQRMGGHEQYVKESRAVHGDDYEYNGMYQGNDIKIAILCKRNPLHGEFMQSPHHHKLGVGCPKCAIDKHESKGMKKLKVLLDRVFTPVGIVCFFEQTFVGLKYKTFLRCDVFIPVLNLIIEYDGSQHFKMSGWRTQEGLIETQIRDQLKDSFCIKHKINLVRIPHTIKVTEMLLMDIADRCRMGVHLYASYQHYKDQMQVLYGNISDSMVIVMSCPTIPDFSA